jgi:hypothetical protein
MPVRNNLGDATPEVVGKDLSSPLVDITFFQYYLSVSLDEARPLPGRGALAVSPADLQDFLSTLGLEVRLRWKAAVGFWPNKTVCQG